MIDRDLGLSGTSGAHQAGFRELMSRVCLGEIGAVSGLEISRLARSNADLGADLAAWCLLLGLYDQEDLKAPSRTSCSTGC